REQGDLPVGRRRDERSRLHRAGSAHAAPGVRAPALGQRAEPVRGHIRIGRQAPARGGPCAGRASPTEASAKEFAVSDSISPKQFRESEGVDDWRVLGDGANAYFRTVLDNEPRRDSPAEDLGDPHGRAVPFWFEQMKEPRADGGGAIHIAIWVPYEQAEARIAAGLAAGGRMVRDQFAPSWWTLADAAGNEADIATTKGRD